MRLTECNPIRFYLCSSARPYLVSAIFVRDGSDRRTLPSEPPSTFTSMAVPAPLSPPASKKDPVSPHARPPVPPPTLTVKMIRDAVPKHCFERSLLRSLSHLLLDLLMITALGVSICYIDRHSGMPRLAVNLLAWPLYWWSQGAVMTGVWVLAHECGHQAFSKWKFVNDAFGLVLHSALFVPYHSWRITHAQHHKHTNHSLGDQVFVPMTRGEYNAACGITLHEDGSHSYRSAISEAIEETPIGDVYNIVKMFLLGWPAYLFANAAGQKYGPGTNHFNPKAKMFSARDYWDVVVSDIGLIVAFGALVFCIRKFTFLEVLKYYLIPYLIVNSWLVLITYLQHSDPAIPHYTPKEFNFVRGALCSIDRDYGICNVLQHRIGQTHVVHHLFSQMPFYHSLEATEAVKKVLGPHYYCDKTSIWQAVRRSWKYCKFVDPNDGDIMYFKNYCKDAKVE